LCHYNGQLIILHPTPPTSQARHVVTMAEHLLAQGVSADENLYYLQIQITPLVFALSCRLARVYNVFSNTKGMPKWYTAYIM